MAGAVSLGTGELVSGVALGVELVNLAAVAEEAGLVLEGANTAAVYGASKAVIWYSDRIPVRMFSGCEEGFQPKAYRRPDTFA